jgi:hypothetical protein
MIRSLHMRLRLTVARVNQCRKDRRAGERGIYVDLDRGHHLRLALRGIGGPGKRFR